MSRAEPLAGLQPVALLCDADGNLFPSEEPAFAASAAVTNAFLQELGVARRFTPEELRLATTGKNFRTTAVDLAVAHHIRLEHPLVVREPVPAAVGAHVLGADVLEDWVQEETRQVTQHLGAVLKPDDEVRGPLTSLAQRYRLAAVSSSALVRLAACFTATGLDEIIPATARYSAEDSLPIPTSKPDPAVYLHACAELRLQPSQALAVEDSVPGVQSAVAAGITTVGNVQFVPPAERADRVAQLEAAGATTVVSSWGELEQLLTGTRTA